MYLWGIHLSKTETLLLYETVFLRRALQQLSTEVLTNFSGAMSVPQIQMTHTLQAHVLLAYYFFRNNQFFEAGTQTSAAVSMALGYDLWKMYTAQPDWRPSILGVANGREIYPPAAGDALEEGERINGFWTVFALERSLSMTLDSASQSFGSLRDPCMQIDTPWPQDIIDYSPVRWR